MALVIHFSLLRVQATGTHTQATRLCDRPPNVFSRRPSITRAPKLDSDGTTPRGREDGLPPNLFPSAQEEKWKGENYLGTETSRPASQETIAQRRDKTRRQPILASRHHRPTIPTSKSQTSKRRRCCRATRNHHRLPPPGAPTGNTPQRRHAPARRHFPTHPASRHRGT